MASAAAAADELRLAAARCSTTWASSAWPAPVDPPPAVPLPVPVVTVIPGELDDAAVEVAGVDAGGAVAVTVTGGAVAAAGIVGGGGAVLVTTGADASACARPLIVPAPGAAA